MGIGECSVVILVRARETIGNYPKRSCEAGVSEPGAHQWGQLKGPGTDWHGLPPQSQIDAKTRSQSELYQWSSPPSPLFQSRGREAFFPNSMGEARTCTELTGVIASQPIANPWTKLRPARYNERQLYDIHIALCLTPTRTSTKATFT